jgi:outer membrane lipoprotein SlyB
VSSGRGRAIASAAGKGAVVGGATGAVAELFSHDVKTGALAGGAIGATAAGTSAALAPDQVKRNFVNRCLHDRGYQVIGWK